MAVQKNPYWEWEDIRDRADYRSKETQASSLTRQMLRQAEYLRFRNRVNPGPVRNSRAKNADLNDQIPHNASNEDFWGWQSWADLRRYLEQSEFSSNLLEEGGLITPQGETVPFPIYTDPQTSSVYNRPGVGIRFRGQVPTVSSLPTNAVGGDAYIVQSDDSFRVWDPVTNSWISGGSIRGNTGPVGPVNNPLVFTQSTPSTTWVINHNLGYIPTVELYDSEGDEIEAAISHPTINQTVVTLSIPTAGSARLIGTPYVFVQEILSDTWVINHNLGYNPAVELYNNEDVEIDAYINHPSINQTVVRLSAPATGSARLT